MAKRKYVRKKKPAQHAADLATAEKLKGTIKSQMTQLENAVIKMSNREKRTLQQAILTAQIAFDHGEKDFFRACRNAFQYQYISFRRIDFDVLDDKVFSTFKLTHNGEELTNNVSVNLDGDVAAALALSMETWLRDFFMVQPVKDENDVSVNLTVRETATSPIGIKTS